MEVVVRLLGLDDLALLLDADSDVFGRTAPPDLATAFLADPRHHIVGAIAEGTLVGFASAVDYLRPEKPPELFIHEVGVARRLHRRGVGLRLVRAMLEHGRALGCAEAWVATELENAPARALYRAAGGEPNQRPAEIFTFHLDSSTREPCPSGSTTMR